VSSLWPSIGWYWLADPLLAAIFGLLLVLAGFRHLLTGHPGKGGARLIVGVPVLVIGLGLSLLALNVQSFARLTHEGDVADVRVKSLDPAHAIYAVTVTRLDGPNQTFICNIQGDEWQLTARVQKWKPWANVLGLDSTYTLDQIGNKYFTAARGQGAPITACDLTGPEPAVNQYVPRSWLFWILDHSFAEDRRFGSAVYMPLRDGADYKVVMTQSGLNAEPVNDAARTANNGQP